MHQIKGALRKLQKRAVEATRQAEKEDVKISEHAAALRRRSFHAQALLAAMEEAVLAEEQLEELQKGAQPVVVALAEVLKKKKLKPSELLQSWDDNGDGVIQRAEFHMHIKELGIDAPPADVDKLFDDIDEDNSGTLELVEIKQMPRKLQEASIPAQQAAQKVAEEVTAARQKALKTEQAPMRRLSHGCYTAVTRAVTLRAHDGSMAVTRLLHGCYMAVTRLFPVRSRSSSR